ncbi:MAG TPA: winged helix DNA-binding protein [Sphingomonas sp.]|nr:winged helix DNA-binding protein [Sphingomonas sp.]
MSNDPNQPSYAAAVGPTVLLFCDDPARRAELAAAIAEAGGRVAASEPLAEALARLDGQLTAGGVVVEVVEDGGAMLDTLLAHLDAAAATMRFSSVITIPHALIDVAAARIADERAQLLVEPDDGELAAALVEMLGTAGGGVRDNANEANSRRLAQLSEEVGRIARTLAALSGDEGAVREPAAALRLAGGSGESASDGAMARAILRLRRLRDQHFNSALFADPAWDMLLDLTAARHERRPVAVSSLCIAAAVPATTALRWIGTMTDHGLLARHPDPDDGRRVFIALTERAAGAMAAYCASARRVLEPAA